MNEKIEALRNWNCDIDGAMERFLNDEEMYLSFLPTVANEPAFDALGKAIEANDVKDAFEQSHLLKGVVANMGLTPILDVIVKIVEPARAGTLDGAEGNYQELVKQLNQFKAIIG